MERESTLIFVDVLGFAKLTEKHPEFALCKGPDDEGFESCSTSLSHEQLVNFDQALNRCIEYHRPDGIQAMVFSDCAFLDLDNTLRSAIAAADMMRKFIEASVPVRIGLGKGTFRMLKSSIDVEDPSLVIKARFSGTAVVRARAAESCGEKGMRVLLHPSLDDQDIQSIRSDPGVLKLGSCREEAKWELNYLLERPGQPKTPGTPTDCALFGHVVKMKEAYPGADCHYAETLKALNRMRKANNVPQMDCSRRGAG